MSTTIISARKQNELDRESSRAFLLEVFNKQNRPVVWTVLRHVSASGMSRDISLFTVHDGELMNITWHASKVSRANSALKSRNGFNVVRVSGCGMDMGFHSVYSLSMALFCPNQYDHDSAYKLNQRWL
jgi:hypothetical protein